MEKQPVIADEQDLERREDEHEVEEDDLGDGDEVMDVLDDDLEDDLEALDEDDDLADDDADDDVADDVADDEDESEEQEDEEEEEEDEVKVLAEESDSTSLEELLARRSAARRGTDDSDEVDDLIALSSEATRREARAKAKVAPLRNREEFVCKRCFLLKPKVQLADSNRMLCRDCV
ncbi:MAG: DUF4193 family protein [Actinomycetota bacterium]